MPLITNDQLKKTLHLDGTLSLTDIFHRVCDNRNLCSRAENVLHVAGIYTPKELIWGDGADLEPYLKYNRNGCGKKTASVIWDARNHLKQVIKEGRGNKTPVFMLGDIVDVESAESSISKRYLMYGYSEETKMYKVLSVLETRMVTREIGEIEAEEISADYLEKYGEIIWWSDLSALKIGL